MPQCPFCYCPLPLREVVKAKAELVCPDCHRKLTRPRWAEFVSGIVATLVIDGVRHLAEGSGFSTPLRIIGSLACGLAAGALVYLLLVRYQVKDPDASILSSSETWQGEDSSHNK